MNEQQTTRKSNKRRIRLGSIIYALGETPVELRVCSHNGTIPKYFYGIGTVIPKSFDKYFVEKMYLDKHIKYDIENDVLVIWISIS